MAYSPVYIMQSTQIWSATGHRLRATDLAQFLRSHTGAQLVTGLGPVVWVRGLVKTMTLPNDALVVAMTNLELRVGDCHLRCRMKPCRWPETLPNGAEVVGTAGCELQFCCLNTPE